MVGGYFDKYHLEWDEAALRWFEALIDEQDVDIIAWAFNQADPPASYDGPMLTALRVLDYIDIPR
jgi:antitoxin CptB